MSEIVEYALASALMGFVSIVIAATIAAVVDIPTYYRHAKNEKHAEQMAEQVLRGYREWAEIQAKDEILAYFKEGEPAKDVVRRLVELPAGEGGYDHFWYMRKDVLPKIRKSQFGQMYPGAVSAAVATILGKEYGEIIRAGVASLHTLEEFGYTKEKAIALLSREPLVKWEKTVRRIIEQK